MDTSPFIFVEKVLWFLPLITIGVVSDKRVRLESLHILNKKIRKMTLKQWCNCSMLWLRVKNWSQQQEFEADTWQQTTYDSLYTFNYAKLCVGQKLAWCLQCVSNCKIFIHEYKGFYLVFYYAIALYHRNLMTANMQFFSNISKYIAVKIAGNTVVWTMSPKAITPIILSWGNYPSLLP